MNTKRIVIKDKKLKKIFRKDEQKERRRDFFELLKRATAEIPKSKAQS